MAAALEAIVKSHGNGADPNFSRGAELEITTMQDVEMLKAHLAAMKIHIPTISLERGIIMPRDLETGGMNYPRPEDLLVVNPYRTEKKKVGKTRKGKKGKKVGEGAGGGRNLRQAAVYDDLPNGGKL